MGLWGICLIPAPWLFGSAEILQFSLAQDTELYSVLFSILDHHFLQWCWNRGGQGGHCPPPQYLADQLTLLELGRADYLHLLLLVPSIFFTFQHH